MRVKGKGLTHSLDNIDIIKGEKNFLGAFGQYPETKLGSKTDEKCKKIHFCERF